jgi:hypothetical protein
MTIDWSHLMQYRSLPDDFREKYRSVWVGIPAHLWDSKRGHHLYNEHLDELEFAEKMEMDGICVNEHHANEYGLMPSPNIMAASLDLRTSHAACVGGCAAAARPTAMRGGRDLRSLRCLILPHERPRVSDARGATRVRLRIRTSLSEPLVPALRHGCGISSPCDRDALCCPPSQRKDRSGPGRRRRGS